MYHTLQDVLEYDVTHLNMETLELLQVLLYVKTSLFVKIINYHKLLQKHVVNTFKIKNKIFYYARYFFI